MTDQPFAVPALLLFLLAIPLAVGVIPMNRFYGLRNRQWTLSNDHVWYPVNRMAGIAFMISSVVYGVVAAVRPYDRQASNNFATWGIHLAAFVIPLIISIVLATLVREAVLTCGWWDHCFSSERQKKNISKLIEKAENESSAFS